MPKVRRERRSPEEAYKVMEARLRGGRPASRRDRRPWRIFAIGLGVIVMLAAIGLVVVLVTGNATTVPAARTVTRYSAESCFDAKGNLPSLVQQVGRQLGIAARILPTSTTATPDGDQYRIVMRYHPDIVAGEDAHSDTAIALLDPRYCTTKLITAVAR